MKEGILEKNKFIHSEMFLIDPMSIKSRRGKRAQSKRIKLLGSGRVKIISVKKPQNGGLKFFVKSKNGNSGWVPRSRLRIPWDLKTEI